MKTALLAAATNARLFLLTGVTSASIASDAEADTGCFVTYPFYGSPGTGGISRNKYGDSFRTAEGNGINVAETIVWRAFRAIRNVVKARITAVDSALNEQRAVGGLNNPRTTNWLNARYKLWRISGVIRTRLKSYQKRKEGRFWYVETQRI